MIKDTAAREGDHWTISAPTAWDTSSLAGLRAVLQEDRESTLSTWHYPGRQALAVHRFGTWIQSDGPARSVRRPAVFLHKSMRAYVRNVLGFEIHQEVKMGRRVRFMHQHGVVIDEACVIGDDCVFHHGVTLASNNGDHLPQRPYHAPQVGARVRFGAGCIVIGGVRIGDGATIGPNAVVTTDVPPGASAVALAARILRLR